MSQTWIEKPSILLTESKLLEFIPNNEMTYPEKLNALTRFIIATAIIIALIRRELFVLLIPLCCMVVIYFLTKWGLNLSEIKRPAFTDSTSSSPKPSAQSAPKDIKLDMKMHEIKPKATINFELS